jgi:SAM-dependent methyltransferase
MLTFFLKNVLGKKAVWDAQYWWGNWDYLKDTLETDRYQAVLNAVDKYAHNGHILEVGCGEGILQSRMRPGSYTKFIGIDFSKIAIKKAAPLRNVNTFYLCADMEVYEPKERFDTIVFNESLYYSKRPVQLMQRYARFLRAGGSIILSIYESEETRDLREALQSHFAPLEQTVSRNERASWYCQVYDRDTLLRQNRSVAQSA